MDPVLLEYVLNTPLINCGSPSDETATSDAPCHSRCDIIKSFFFSNTVDAEERPRFCSPSP